MSKNAEDRSQDSTPKPKRRERGIFWKRGSLWVEYGWRGRRYREPAKTTRLTQARNLRNRRLEELRRGIHGRDLERTTFADLERGLIDDYTARANRSLTSIPRRLAHLRAAFERVPAVDIGFDRLNGFVKARLEASASRSTVQYELRLLHRAFVLAVRAGKVAHVPPFPTVTVSNARKVFAAPGELERIVAKIPEDFRPVVRTLGLTGWRAREVLGLRWCDVDGPTATVKLPVERSKNKRPRFFPYGALPPLAALIAERRARTEERERELGRVIPTVFWRSRDRAPLSYDVFREAWVEAAKEARLSHLRPHDLRRSAARALVRAGVNERVVMRLLGWETPAMLARYDILATSDLEDGVARLGAFLGGHGPKTAPAVEAAEIREDEATAEDAARRGYEDGATPRNRTADTVIFSHVLYQLS